MTIHDYFDGTAHCEECGGPCRLDVEAVLTSNAIRHLSEALARAGYGPNMMIRDALQAFGVNVERYWDRAREAARR